ncbi:hypothetical protein AAZV13_12G094800 [Glycine max]|uniref:60S ribosomal protein L13a n=1 Tax=Glycine max TaxID=3847 RepID=UPI0002964247|nr:60S ribosomal protein L13a-like [Glycine max]
MLGHKYCILGRLSSEVGWNLFDIIRELEKKRKDKAQLVYERKKHLNNLRVKAEKVAEDKLATVCGLALTMDICGSQPYW